MFSLSNVPSKIFLHEVIRWCHVLIHTRFLVDFVGVVVAALSPSTSTPRGMTIS